MATGSSTTPSRLGRKRPSVVNTVSPVQGTEDAAQGPPRGTRMPQMGYAGMGGGDGQWYRDFHRDSGSIWGLVVSKHENCANRKGSVRQSLCSFVGEGGQP